MSPENKKRNKEEKAILCSQSLKKEDILAYLPDTFKRKLTKKEIGYIQDAFYKAALFYQNQEEQNYLDKMLV